MTRVRKLLEETDRRTVAAAARAKLERILEEYPAVFERFVAKYREIGANGGDESTEQGSMQIAGCACIYLLGNLRDRDSLPLLFKALRMKLDGGSSPAPVLLTLRARDEIKETTWVVKPIMKEWKQSRTFDRNTRPCRLC
jgi:hypothetical protein